jgi:hypothetical protein
MRSGNKDRRVSTEVPLGIRELAGWAEADNDVTPSSRRLFLQSTKRPK